MKRFSKILAVLLILSVIPVSAATYTLVKANYPILINGQNLAVQPLNYNGTTYLPLRSISEAVGVPIEWNGAKKSVEINTLDVDKLKESCKMIFAENSSKGSQGSVVAWDNGEYLTAYHIIDDGKTDIRTSDNDELTIGETNAKLDIATLKTTDNVKPVKIGDSDEVNVGDKVIIISSPHGERNTVFYGKVEINSTQIVVTGAVGNGASGGGVFNMNGELIGILTSGNEAVKDCYVTPINAIREAF
jgi:S1-C subfamily serine protease